MTAVERTIQRERGIDIGPEHTRLNLVFPEPLFPLLYRGGERVGVGKIIDAQPESDLVNVDIPVK